MDVKNWNPMQNAADFFFFGGGGGGHFINMKDTFPRCSIDSGTCYQVNRMSTQTWHVVG